MIGIFPQDFLVRAPTMDDVKAVAELMAICDIAEYGEPETTEEDVRSSFQTPGFDLTKDTWLVVAPGGRIVGRIGVGHREPTRMYTFPRVHPDYTDLGIEAHLLRLAEARACELIPEAPQDARVTLNSWVNNVNVSLERVLEEEGYRRVRGHWTMEIELDQAPPAPQWPENVTVRPFVLGEERAVFEAFDEAFRDHWGYMPENYQVWQHWTVKREDFDPTLWFLAFEGDEIAGLSLCEYQLDVGWVGDLAVRRPWRRKGLGMALLRHSFGEFFRRGSRKVRLGVDSQNLTGATRLYERSGMHRIRQSYNYEKELRAGVELSTQALAI